jgi:hypothetical protein
LQCLLRNPREEFLLDFTFQSLYTFHDCNKWLLIYTRENSNASKEEVEKEKALSLKKAKRTGGATSAPEVFWST